LFYQKKRQQDATRNSIQALAQSEFSHKELQGLNNDQLQEKLFQEKHINWDKLPTHLKRGSCFTKEEFHHENDDSDIIRIDWRHDDYIPIFTQDREYIERFV